MSLSPETVNSMRFPAKPGQIIGLDVKLWKRRPIFAKISDLDSNSIPDHFTLVLYVKFWNDHVHDFYLDMEEILSILQTLGCPCNDKDLSKRNLEGLFVHVKYEGGGQGGAMLISIFGKENDKVWQPIEPFFASTIYRSKAMPKI